MPHILSRKPAGLNSAVKEATEWCMQQGAQAVLILPADIPLLSSEDVNKIVELGKCEGANRCVVSLLRWRHKCSFPESAKLNSCVFWTKKLLKAHQRGSKKRSLLEASLLNRCGYGHRFCRRLESNCFKTEDNTACRRVLDTDVRVYRSLVITCK